MRKPISTYSPNIALFTLNRSRAGNLSSVDAHKRIIATILDRYNILAKYNTSPPHHLYDAFEDIPTLDCLSLLAACKKIFELTRPRIIQKDNIFQLLENTSALRLPHNEHYVYLSLQHDLLRALNIRRAPEVLDLALSGSTIPLLYLTAIPGRLGPLLQDRARGESSIDDFANNIFEAYKRRKCLTAEEAVEAKAIAYFLVHSATLPSNLYLQNFPEDIQDNPLIRTLVSYSRVPPSSERSEANADYVNAIRQLQALSCEGTNLQREFSPRSATIATAAAYASACLGYIYSDRIYNAHVLAESFLLWPNRNTVSAIHHYTLAYLQGDHFSLTQLEMIYREGMKPHHKPHFLSFCAQQNLDPKLFENNPLPTDKALLEMLLLLHNPDAEEKPQQPNRCCAIL